MTTYVAVFALVLAYVALVGAYLALRTLARVRRANALLAAGAETPESMLEATGRHIALTAAVADEVARLRGELAEARGEVAALQAAVAGAAGERQADLTADRSRSLRNVALVRYDAFDDMAGRLSFSLALLDDGGDGVALSALAGRSDTRVYAKGVTAGTGEHELSPEEAKAVASALRGRSARRLAHRKAS